MQEYIDGSQDQHRSIAQSLRHKSSLFVHILKFGLMSDAIV
jgi:hypothetical protein